MKLKIQFIGLSLVLLFLNSCGFGDKLVLSNVAYQSIRTNVMLERSDVPATAKIMVEYYVDGDGNITPIVTNLTNQIMTIDNTKSFFVNSDGSSTIFYDPTVRTNTQSRMHSDGSSVGVNLGAIGGALGIGGPIGQALSGINVGESTQQGTVNTTSTMTVDMPQESVAPRGSHKMKTFSMNGIGSQRLKNLQGVFGTAWSSTDSPYKYSVCISYSFQGENELQNIITDLYVNSMCNVAVTSNGETNKALRAILQQKNDALAEPWFVFYFNNNIESVSKGCYESRLYDCK